MSSCCLRAGRQRGVTLIEVIVVLALLGILVGVASISYQRTQAGGEDHSALVLLRTLTTAIVSDVAASGAGEFNVNAVRNSVASAAVNVDHPNVPAEFLEPDGDVTAADQLGVAFATDDEVNDSTGHTVALFGVAPSGKPMAAVVPFPDKYQTTLAQPVVCFVKDDGPENASEVVYATDFCENFS